MPLRDRLSLLLAAFLLSFGATAGAAPAKRSAWVASWASAQQVPEPHNALPADDLRNATLRQFVRLSVGGKRLRLRVSNAFGTAPLRIGGAGVALSGAPGTAAIVPGSHRAVLFSGRSDAVIPAGAELLSDPVDLPLPPLARVAVSLYFPEPPQQQTGHPGSRSTSWYVRGNAVGSAGLEGSKNVDHWYQLSGIEVESAGPAAAVVALGDSITDGRGATTNGDNRWPDLLAERLQRSRPTRGIAVLNVGIGGNRLLLDGLGPNALARFDRDVLAHPGVRTVILLEGINDIGTAIRDRPLTPAEHDALVERVTGAYAQLVARARAQGIRIVGATLLPFVGSGYKPDAGAEADRQRINAWIRTPGNFDAVIDFDRVMRDPARPDQLRAEFDSGDKLHPSPAGYRAMAEAVPLGLLSR